MLQSVLLVHSEHEQGTQVNPRFCSFPHMYGYAGAHDDLFCDDCLALSAQTEKFEICAVLVDEMEDD